jgi:ribokinase
MTQPGGIAMTVMVIGSYNRDWVLSLPHLPAPGETIAARGLAQFDGGKGSNQAVQAARCGAEVVMVAALGADAGGQAARALWAAEGITPIIEHSAEPTGQAVIFVDAAGENCIAIVPGANAALSSAHVAAAIRAGAPRLVLAQREVPADATLAGFHAARAIGARTVLNAAPAGPVPEALLGATDLLLVNAGEALAMGGGLPALAARHAMGVIVTRGAAGATHVGQDGRSRDWPAFAVRVRDTTGAGDAFAGAVAAALADGAGIEAAMPLALAAGALACTVDGAVPSLHGRAAITALAAGCPIVVVPA